MRDEIRQAVWVGTDPGYEPGGKVFMREFIDYSKTEAQDALIAGWEYAVETGQTLRIYGVIPAFYSSSGVDYGDLRDIGLVTKDYEPGFDPDSPIIVWTVIGDVVFTDRNNNIRMKGDIVRWEK